MILNSLTYDLRSRILGRKRKQARAAIRTSCAVRTTGYALNIYVWSDHLLRAMSIIFTFGPISVLRAMPVVVG